MSALRLLLLAACLLVLPAKAQQAGIDVGASIELRRDVLLLHVGRGATPEEACAVVLRYFGGVCKTDGKTYTLADAPGNGASFFAIIRLDQ